MGVAVPGSLQRRERLDSSSKRNVNPNKTVNHTREAHMHMHTHTLLWLWRKVAVENRPAVSCRYSPPQQVDARCCDTQQTWAQTRSYIRQCEKRG